MRSTCLNRVLWAVAVLLVSHTVASAQVLRGSIAGTVRDSTGASLPGVTVTVSSPALQVPQILRVTDERGEYQVLELPVGTFRVAFELAGFRPLVREGIVLTTGFAARLDVILPIGTVEETITVSGESPLVDLTSTRGGTTVSKDLIASVPISMNYRDVLMVVGGIVTNNPPLLGQVGTGPSGFGGRTYGSVAGTTSIEGVKMNDNESPDFTAYEEVDVKTFGNTADVDQPGASVQLIVKSGGNAFHGRYTETAQHRRIGGTDNIDDRLRSQGLSTGDAVEWYNDLAGDLGGRIIRDKLWFYGSVREYRNKSTVTGFVAGPGDDGKYRTVDDPPASPVDWSRHITWKMSYQATANHRFIGFQQWNRDSNLLGAGATVPLESTDSLAMYMVETKPVEWQGALSNRLFVNMMWGFGGYDAMRMFTGDFPVGTPARLDRATGQETGPSFRGVGSLRRNKPTRNQFSGTISYTPGESFMGSHALQTGFRVWLGTQLYQNPTAKTEAHRQRNEGRGEYQLVFDTIGGVPLTPVEMVTRNYPVLGISRQNVYSIYAMDSWRPSSRVTMNLGLRWERQVHYVPPQVKVQGTFGPSGSFPAVDVGTWSEFAPRAGVAFDLSGDGRTVVKSTWGVYNHDLGVNGFAQNFNANFLNIFTYRWNDLNRDSNYQPGEVDLDLNGRDILGIVGPANNVLNPDLKLPKTYEATASIERQLGRAVAIRGLFVYKRVRNEMQFVNALRPFSVYNRVFTRRDPGPNGTLGNADDGDLVTFYDYDPAYRGGNFVANMFQNADTNRQDSFRNLEFMATVRPTGKWFANASFLATKNHRWLVTVPQSPNDNVNAIDETWDMSGRLAAGYNAPFGINVSTLYQAYNGLPRQRTHIFRVADPQGGPSLPSSGSITMRMEPFGSKRGPARHIVNLRGEKVFRLGIGRMRTGIDLFNLFNTNVAWGTGFNPGITDQSGPTYDRVTRIVQPRIVRLTVGYDF